jgi:hypothetical protein
MFKCTTIFWLFSGCRSLSVCHRVSQRAPPPPSSTHPHIPPAAPALVITMFYSGSAMRLRERKNQFKCALCRTFHSQERRVSAHTCAPSTSIVFALGTRRLPLPHSHTLSLLPYCSRRFKPSSPTAVTSAHATWFSIKPRSWCWQLALKAKLSPWLRVLPACCLRQTTPVASVFLPSEFAQLS